MQWRLIIFFHCPRTFFIWMSENKSDTFFRQHFEVKSEAFWSATPKPKHISKCKTLGATYFSFGVSFQNVSDFSFNFKMLPDNGLTFILGHWFVLLSSNLLPFSTIARLVWQHKQQVIEWSFSFCLDISKVVWGMNHADQ